MWSFKPLLRMWAGDDKSYVTDHIFILQKMSWTPHAISQVRTFKDSYL